MPLSHDEASSALREITAVEQRSGSAYGYQLASPHLILWGAIWIVGYGVSFWRRDLQIVWPVLTICGAIGSFWLGSRNRAAGTADWRYITSLVAIFAFVAAIFAIMPPRTAEQAGAFFPMLVALFYAIAGIWTKGRRLLLLGAAIGVLSIAGYFYLPHVFLLWMAIVGGGGLILGGFWLRSL